MLAPKADTCVPVYVSFCLCTQDGNGQFPFPKLLERGSTSSVASEGVGVAETLPEHVDAPLKGISTLFMNNNFH